ncbi:sigma-70 family RNA polymerase sigma factor [Runella sp. MFBS21]|uniref:RNA polymerase sigma factor n=1 Tax=Runella sp. MFBS21 TaxID=3034018 RepID=UPI0023F912A5|nr:sigma-70 family RNA polymerase sigma factor [Runella sp. MFBS21]MDF7821823.1 sigma-70 family RNA polymerase sigma factor [Runella sp. MFBS21]
MPLPNSNQHNYPNEAQFYEDLQAERPEAFNHLYLQTYQKCLPFALSKGSSQDEAKDLLQECLAIFVEKIRNGTYAFRADTKITTYFYSIYINQWKKAFEHKTKRAEVRLQTQYESPQDDAEETFKESISSTPFRVTLQDEDGHQEDISLPDMIDLADYDDSERSWIFRKLQRAMKLLSEDCQEVLTWFYIEDWSLKNIAQALNITEESATVKRFRCAKYLKEKFRLA